MKTTMTPLFSLVAAAFLPWGYDAFVVVPPATTVGARGGSVSELQAKAPTVDEIQQRKDARAALLDSGGVDKLMSMLTKLRGSDTDVGAGSAAPAPAPKKAAAPVEAVAAAPVEAVATPAKKAAAPVAAAVTPAAPAAAAAAPPQQQKKQRKKKGKKAAASPKAAAGSDPGPSA